MQMIKIRHIFFAVIVLLAWSCKKLDKYPPEPRIDYLGMDLIYNYNDSIFDRGILRFSFTDGDGDLGLSKSDTLPPFHFGGKYYFNLIITYFEIRDGVITEVPLTFYNPNTQEFDTISLSARLPNLTPDGLNKSISGEIYDTLFIYNYNSRYDSILFEAYVIDRSLNESNVIRTDTLVRILQ